MSEWKMVPVEPSLEMMKAGHAKMPSANSFGVYGEIYVAMVAAAPIDLETIQKPAFSVGVSNDNSKLFVHGNYESIKATQAIILERNHLKDEVDSLRKDAERYRWLISKGHENYIGGTGSQSLGFGPAVCISFPSSNPVTAIVTESAVSYLVDTAMTKE